jgi:hypothetical protein
MPVAKGIMSEKLFVDSALNKASAEKTISAKAAMNGIFITNVNHSFMLDNDLPLRCHLINAAPDTLSIAYKMM